MYPCLGRSMGGDDDGAMVPCSLLLKSEELAEMMEVTDNCWRYGVPSVGWFFVLKKPSHHNSEL